MEGKKLMLLLAALGLAFLAASGAEGEKVKELTVGDAAPDFELQGSDGKTYHLSDFKDRQAVVVAWFPKAFTGGCTAQCKSMRETGAGIREYEVKYFAASTDDAETNRKFAESLELDYPILSDPSKKVAQAYGVLKPEGYATRWTYYIGRDGKVAYIDREVKPATAGTDTAARLAALGVPKAKQ